jgi:hypothetical protein
MAIRKSPFTLPGDEELWRVFDEKRYREREHIDSDTLEAMTEAGIKCDWRAVDVLNTQLGSEATISPVLTQQIDLVKMIMRGQKGTSVFDPWAQHGGLICALLDQGIVSSAIGISQNVNQLQIFNIISDGLQSEMIYQNPFDWLNSCDQEFDLVVSMPPFGWEPQTLLVKKDGIEYNVFDEFANLLLLQCSRRLKPDGKVVFVVSPKFVLDQKENCVRRMLPKLDLGIEAYFAMPSEILFPLTGVPAAGLVVISHGIKEKIFVALLTEDRKRNLTILGNYVKGKSGKTLNYGKIVAEADFVGYDRLAISEKILRKARQTGVKAQALGTLALEFVRPDKNLDGKFEDAENAIYLPVIGEPAEVVSSLGELTRKPEMYIQIKLDQNLAISEHVTQFFNTDLGRTCLKQFQTGGTLQRIPWRDLNDISVYLPDIKRQKEILRINRKIQETKLTLKTFASELWERPRNHKNLEQKLDALVNENPAKASMDAWCDSLPFPLSTILWTYQVCGKDQKRRYESLLYFFEALSEFWATIFLSALEIEDDFARTQKKLIQNTLGTQELSLGRSTFGCWQIICALLAKQFRKHLFEEKNNIDPRMYFRTADREIITMLTSKKLISLLQEINHLRNTWKGHGGIVSDRTASEHHDILRKHLISLRSIFGTVWQRFSLIRPRVTQFSEGIYHYEVDMLMGSRSPFKIKEMELLDPLNNNDLYFIDSAEQRGLQLLPLFKVVASPPSAENACYFYNRIDPGGTRFVSYHFEGQEEILDTFEDTVKIINELSNVALEKGNPEIK